MMVGATLPLFAAGLLTMNSFTALNYYFNRQIVWIAIGFVVFVVASCIDWRFLKRSWLLAGIFGFFCLLLLALVVFGHTVRGVSSWLSFGGVSVEPADFMKLFLIILLSKYFSRRHIEIAHIRHIMISGMYAFIPFVLVFLQPDFGSAIIIFFIWLGMIMVSGVSKRHLLLVFFVGALAFGLLWISVLKPYQKTRVLTFLYPLADVRGAGYNAFQSQIAVGAGELMGKGVGYGTQSRLKFLPEYQTDFIFAAFAEEWGFVGVLLLFALFGIILWRILAIARVASTNFEMLFGMGLATFFMTHVMVHIGMNSGILPVTGIPLPFVSYGGSHIVTECAGLGILTGMRRYSRAAHRDDMRNEFVGAV